METDLSGRHSRSRKIVSPSPSFGMRRKSTYLLSNFHEVITVGDNKPDYIHLADGHGCTRNYRDNKVAIISYSTTNLTKPYSGNRVTCFTDFRPRHTCYANLMQNDELQTIIQGMFWNSWQLSEKCQWGISASVTDYFLLCTKPQFQDKYMKLYDGVNVADN